MLTGKHATQLWTKLSTAPPEWFRDPRNAPLLKKCVKMVRDTDGKAEARMFLYLTWLARVIP